MIERLIENWLINVNELGYQIPFCEVLIANNYTILHISKHGRGEHGKDVIARDSKGRLTTFQLKGGDINLPVWREIRGEVEDLVKLPVMLPGVNREEAHRPILVTNGELKGDAITSIQEYTDDWVRRGYPRMQVWQKHQLLTLFIKSHGKYLPNTLVEFRKFIELYVSNFSDRIPRENFSNFLISLSHIPSNHSRERRLKRAIESLVLISSYIIEQYEREGNYISAAEGWMITAAAIMHIVEREKLPDVKYKPTLELIWQALELNLNNFAKEVFERSSFIETNLILAETDLLRGARVLLVLGWLIGTTLIKKVEGKPELDRIKILEIINREFKNISITSEADWPIIILLSIYLERILGSSRGEKLINDWINIILSANNKPTQNGIPSPYWLQERAISLNYNLLPPHERETFFNHSYTIFSAIDMLVRRMCRQQVASIWPSASRLTFCEYNVDDHSEYFLWSSTKGNLSLINHNITASWGDWRNSTASINKGIYPKILIENQKWIIPFALTFPHKVNRKFSGLMDCLIGERCRLL